MGTLRFLKHFGFFAALAAVATTALAWTVLATDRPELREERHVIPHGTWARRHAGEKLDVLPSEIHLTLGVKDILVLQNRDEVPQMFGAVLIMPGQDFRLPFNVASRYDFACTAHVKGQLTVFVAPAPDWWTRLHLRVASILKSSTSS